MGSERAKPKYPCQERKYGFRYGPVLVQRFFSDERGVCIGLTTKRRNAQIWISPTGLIRFSKQTKPSKWEVEQVEKGE